MPNSFQIVENCFEKVKTKISPYLYGLLFHKGRKNCSSMSRGVCLPDRQIRKSFNNAAWKIQSIRDNLKQLTSKVPVEDGFKVLAIDGTMLAKSFAKKIDHLAFDYDGVIRRATRGLSIMVISMISGKNSIPLDFSFWENESKPTKSKKRKRRAKIKPNSKHKTKIEKAIELIKGWKDLVCFSYVSMDGAFCSEKMVHTLQDYKLNYTMRVPRNRKVTINGLELLLKDQPALKFVRNERSKTVTGFYKGHACYFTAHKRKKRNGRWETFFIISNMELSAKEHVIAYSRRWPIDKSFRTMKQYLGLRDCQMRAGIKQTLHILNVFMAYSIATIQKIVTKKKSVEEFLNQCRNSKNFQNIFITDYQDGI